MPPSEIRKEAREALKGKWGKAACIFLVYFAFTFAVSFITELFSKVDILYLLLNLAFLIISVPLSFGLLISFIKLKRGEDVKALGFINDGFSRFSKSWGIGFRIFLKMLLPIICFVIIMFVLGFAIGFNSLSGNETLSMGLTLLTVAVYIACLIYLVSRALLFALSYYIGYDNPELSSKECVLKSAELMKGNRGNIFLLELSFIGWAILAGFTLGIGMLWLMPYMQVSIVCFYERVTNKTVATDPINTAE